jgi:3-hydroxyacyl-[acyl-carrier-protein] dehydratase
MAETSLRALDAADIMELMALLPHRYPFLMIDRVVDIDGDLSGVGIKNVTANEPHFQGHFPGRPVMPGVLLIEGMAQTAGILCVMARFPVPAPSLVYFMTIDKARFRRPVVPGDTVRYLVKKLKRRGNIWWYNATAEVDGLRVAEARLSAMLVDD